jgi:poly(3-hydroxybutyrate) depolymerase
MCCSTICTGASSGGRMWHTLICRALGDHASHPCVLAECRRSRKALAYHILGVSDLEDPLAYIVVGDKPPVGLVRGPFLPTDTPTYQSWH